MKRSSELNLFEFYRDVALRFQREFMGIEMSKKRHDELNSKLYDVQNSYFGFNPPQYDSLDAIVAYTLHFAPKHAVMWRCLGQRMSFEEEGIWDRKWSLNSIGSGPGSEIFGLLCGLPGVENMVVSFVGLEREQAWRVLFEIALEEFVARTGLNVRGFLTNDPKNLIEDGQIIGSLVLSETMKRGDVAELMAAIRRNTNSVEASFLDYNYQVPTTQSGKEFVNVHLKRLGFETRFDPLRDDLKLSDAIKREMANCEPVFCRRQINDRQPLTLYTVTLR